jgi:hypothetical protein
MGYKRSTLLLEFRDPQFEGLEVRMKRLSIGKMLQVSNLRDTDGFKDDEDKLNKLLSILSEAITSWNLEEADDTPVPTTVEGIASIDPEFLFALIDAWLEVALAVSNPLAQRSSNGGSTSPPPNEVKNAGIPMEPLPSQQS